MAGAGATKSIILAALVLVCSVAADEADEPACPVDDPTACLAYKGPSALQRAQSAARVTLESRTLTKHVAGVKVNIHGNSQAPPEGLAGNHTWVITLPEDCSDADVQAFAQRMPAGTRSVFEGTPSDSGVPCVFIMEGTEAGLEEELKTHPGAVLAEIDLTEERHSAELTGHPSDLPVGEGFPQVSDNIMPKRSSAALAEAGGQFHVGVNLDVGVPAWGGNCGGPYKVNVYFPHPNAGRRPLILFSHGYGQGGPNLDAQLRPKFLDPIVAHGFVVIGHQTGRSNWCNTGIEMIKMIEWAKLSPYRNRIDFNQVVVMGYSMGGYFTTFFAEHRSLTTGFKVKGAVALMPPCMITGGCKSPVVPTIWGAGTADTTCPAGPIHQSFTKTRNKAVFVNIQGAPHYEVGKFGHNRFNNWVLHFLYCHLKGSQPHCAGLYSRWPSKSS